MSEEEFTNRQNEILSRLPTSHLWAALASYAWEQGRLYGHEYVLSILEDLVGQLENPLREFGAWSKKFGFDGMFDRVESV